jgi:glyoxylase-like metal-dependent hydrolase (beta-lactamase superfamily II)
MAAVVSPAAAGHAKPMYDIIHLKEDLFCIAFQGNSWPTSSNIYAILDSEGLTLIDAGIDNAECYSALSSCLETVGQGIDAIHTIILTHGHPDHVGGANAICRAVRPRVFIPERSLAEAIDVAAQDYYCLPSETRDIAPRMKNFDLMENFSRTCGSWMLDEELLTPIHENEEIMAGRYALRAIYAPGHDIGLMCFHECSAKFVFTGDLLRSKGSGSALPWYTSTAGGVNAYRKSLDRIGALDARTAFPAHGAAGEDFDNAVRSTKDAIEHREKTILSLLASGPQTCEQLDAHLYRPVVLDICPWYSTVTESHLSSLEIAGVVRRAGLHFCLA